MGPAVTGGAVHPPPWNTKWAAWISDNGIRVGQSALVVLPNNQGGSPSALWSNNPTATQIALGFDPAGLIAIALQTDATTIKVRWFTDPSGVFDQAEFNGFSPAFISNAPVAVSDEPNYPDLALYYLKEETPRVIYVRLERDSFATEYQINSDLQANMSALINGYISGGMGVLYGRDSVGRDVTLKTAPYSIQLHDDSKLSVSILHGNYSASAKSASISATTHREELSVSIVSGIYSMPVVSPPSALSGDEGQLTVGFIGGNYS